MDKRLKIILFIIFSLFFLSSHFSQEIYGDKTLRFSGGIVYSNIDLSLYENSVAYRGLQLRIIAPLGKMISLSSEYSSFPVHKLSFVWEEIRTQKLDINTHVIFSTDNSHASVYALFGLDFHFWKAQRTSAMTSVPFGKDVLPGTSVQLRKFGVNTGVGFIQQLYANFSVMGDFRFSIGNAHGFEKIAIRDVMTTIGISYDIPLLEKPDRKRAFGIGKKIYKWTEKGAK